MGGEGIVNHMDGSVSFCILLNKEREFKDETIC